MTLPTILLASFVFLSCLSYLFSILTTEEPKVFSLNGKFVRHRNSNINYLLARHQARHDPENHVVWFPYNFVHLSSGRLNVRTIKAANSCFEGDRTPLLLIFTKPLVGIWITALNNNTSRIAYGYKARFRAIRCIVISNKYETL
jgi:hypothetical protein